MIALNERKIEADSTCASRTFIKVTLRSCGKALFLIPTSISGISELPLEYQDGTYSRVAVSEKNHDVSETVEEVFEMMRQAGITITILSKE